MPSPPESSLSEKVKELADRLDTMVAASPSERLTKLEGRLDAIETHRRQMEAQRKRAVSRQLIQHTLDMVADILIAAIRPLPCLLWLSLIAGEDFWRAVLEIIRTADFVRIVDLVFSTPGVILVALIFVGPEVLRTFIKRIRKLSREGLETDPDTGQTEYGRRSQGNEGGRNGRA